MSSQLITPTFAIVGHPNKGKSSIVATLSQDESIRISHRSGTTTHARTFPLMVDGETLFWLIDTPGFQRARATLEWMRQYSHSASDRSEVVRQFCLSQQDNPLFHAELQLLQPLVDGAGILYVTDGSVPYGPEYDAEMEILRWTGRPSMALINQIHVTEFFSEWKKVLSQYFKIVRVFNAQNASFEHQLQLLTGFAELNEEWRGPLGKAAASLHTQRQSKIQQAAQIISQLVVQMAGAKRTVPKQSNDNTQDHMDAVREFKRDLIQIETLARQQIEQLFGYQQLTREEQTIEVFNEDLFSEETWRLFGLNKQQLVTAGMVSGAAGGGMLDLGSGGLTLFLGTGAGALLGGASAWFGSRRLAKLKLFGNPLRREEITLGPIENLSFPWVVLGRAIAHLRHVCKRTHAMRDNLRIPTTEITGPSTLKHRDTKALEAIFARIRKEKPLSADQLGKISGYIVDTLDDSPGLESE